MSDRRVRTPEENSILNRFDPLSSSIGVRTAIIPPYSQHSQHRRYISANSLQIPLRQIATSTQRSQLGATTRPPSARTMWLVRCYLRRVAVRRLRQVVVREAPRVTTVWAHTVRSDNDEVVVILNLFQDLNTSCHMRY